MATEYIGMIGIWVDKTYTYRIVSWLNGALTYRIILWGMGYETIRFPHFSMVFYPLLIKKSTPKIQANVKLWYRHMQTTIVTNFHALNPLIYSKSWFDKWNMSFHPLCIYLILLYMRLFEWPILYAILWGWKGCISTSNMVSSYSFNC